MRILQVLPALYSGGVERGTVEFAAELVKRGHESFVLSSGGPMVGQLEREGSSHITMPVHRKSVVSLRQVRPMRELLRQLRPDVIHIRSRMPAWITWMAWKGLPEDRRPVLVSTFHGMYSVNPYSAVMARAQHVIAVSTCVKDYVLSNFSVDPEKLTVIERGVDVAGFRERTLNSGWLDTLLQEHPQLRGKRIIMMPGRISRWKGHALFLKAMNTIIRARPDCHGIVIGGVEPGKDRFMKELKAQQRALGLEQAVTFLGQRSDIAEFYLLSSLVCHMSTKPEPFGRTVTEALASGTPVVAFDRGGAGETLQACFPAGLVEPDNTEAFARKVLELIDKTDHQIMLPGRFHLENQASATLEVYQDLLRQRREE
ncbi:glycosyltransferase family 4 protein [Marinobacter sp.]|uniref:glycosyltransferase family 4 protein n=1 Tax=Marinobacter sp. TaxID=50741 RepID=UPI00384A91EF